MAECYCEKCHKTMRDNQFYKYRDGNFTELCKKCLTMHVDCFREDTFLWLLEKMDVPYVPAEWNSIRDKAYAKDPAKLNGGAVFGKYLAKMKLVQFNKYRWADTEKLRFESEARMKKQAEERAQAEEALKQDLEDGLISEAEYRTLTSVATQKEDDERAAAIAPIAQPATPTFMTEDELVDPAMELTQEDKLYLAMKWGRLYKPSEWIQLEKKYTEMMNSFDIQDADTTGTLILICKTDLKMNQAIDIGDMDGFQKLSRVYDSLRKSAKFTAAQNKEQKSDYVDSIGELVVMCEKQGFIPRYCTDIAQDKADKTLKDMNNYLYKLVTQDLGFGQQIEDALKKIQLQKEMNDSEIILDEDEEDNEIIDQDYEDFYEEINAQKEHDKSLGEEDI